MYSSIYVRERTVPTYHTLARADTRNTHTNKKKKTRIYRMCAYAPAQRRTHSLALPWKENCSYSFLLLLCYKHSGSLVRKPIYKT